MMKTPGPPPPTATAPLTRRSTLRRAAPRPGRTGNGKKSHGPKTERGKANSRWNAVKHTAYAKTLCILEGSHLKEFEHYDQLLDAMRADIPPASPDEAIVLEKWVMDTWRLRRSHRFEISHTEARFDGMTSSTMPNVQRYSNMVNRQWAQSYERLQQLRRRRLEELAGSQDDEPGEDQDNDGPSNSLTA